MSRRNHYGQLNKLSLHCRKRRLARQIRRQIAKRGVFYQKLAEATNQRCQDRIAQNKIREQRFLRFVVFFSVIALILFFILWIIS